MNESDYRKDPAINWSKLKWMKKSPLDYLIRSKSTFKQSDYMRLGSFIDCGLLTPELLESTYVLTPAVNWRSKADKEKTISEYQEVLGFDDEVYQDLISLKKDDAVRVLETSMMASGKVPIPKGNGSDSEVYSYEKGMKIIESNRNKPVFIKMLESVEEIQAPLFAECEKTGLKIKGLLDVITKNSITDLKSIGTLSKMHYNIRSLDYLGQLAYYDYLARLNGIEKKSFWYIFVETCSPYKMKLMEVDPRVIQMEHLSNLELLRQLKECQEAGHFPDGSETPEIYEYREKEGSPMGEAQWLEQTTEGGHDSL